MGDDSRLYQPRCRDDRTVLNHQFKMDKKQSECIHFCSRPSQRARLSVLRQEGGARHLSSRDADLATRFRSPEEAGVPSRLGSGLEPRKLWRFPVVQSRRPQDAASPATSLLPDLRGRLLGGREWRSDLAQDCRRPTGQSGERGGASQCR